MGYPGNDLSVQGKLISGASLEAIDSLHRAPTEPDRKFRNAGWWPSNGTVLKAVFIGLLVIIAIGWALTLLK